MFIETLLRNQSSTTVNARGFVTGPTGAEIYANLAHACGGDDCTFIATIAQSAGTTKVVLQSSHSLDGPWEEVASFSTVNPSEVYRATVKKAPLFRAFLDQAGTSCIVNATLTN